MTTRTERRSNPGEALRAIEDAIRVQGKHPDQRTEGAGVMVNIPKGSIRRQFGAAAPGLRRNVQVLLLSGCRVTAAPLSAIKFC